MKKLLVFNLLLVSLFLVLVQPVYAQEWSSDCIVNGVATLRCIPDLFHNVVNGALMFVGVVAIIMLIYGGIKFINSGGDQKQTTEARKILTFAVLGVILVLGSFAIIYFVGFLTGSTDCITNLDNIKTGGCK
jgi:uncharacterized membrane protein